MVGMDTYPAPMPHTRPPPTGDLASSAELAKPARPRATLDAPARVESVPEAAWPKSPPHPGAAVRSASCATKAVPGAINGGPAR